MKKPWLGSLLQYRLRCAEPIGGDLGGARDMASDVGVTKSCVMSVNKSVLCERKQKG